MPTDSNVSPDAAPDTMAMARSAAGNALAFANILSRRFGAMAEGFRCGNDADSLLHLGEITEDLEDFLTFLVLISEMIETSDPKTFSALRDYHRRLVTTLEGLQPALVDLDLVEVADTLEHDVVGSLDDYRSLNTPVQEALLAA